jgi:hypothetical protein
MYVNQKILTTTKKYHSFILQNALSSPLIGHNYPTHLITKTLPNNMISGSLSQMVAPQKTVDWQRGAQAVPIITEVEPNLQIGDISVGGDMPISGSIKISGMFPVFGTIGVDGKLPTHGTAYVDLSKCNQPCSR